MREIRNDRSAVCRRMACETVHVVCPLKGWTYNHHPFLGWYNGKLYATWSSGRVHEDDLGQRVMLSYTDDFVHWAPPIAVADTQMGKHTEKTLTAGGFYVPPGGALNLYYGEFEYWPQSLENGILRTSPAPHSRPRLLVCRTEDGVQFGPPHDTGMPMLCNMPPVPLKSGRLLLTGHTSVAYTDEAQGIHGWRLGGFCGQAGQEMAYDDTDIEGNTALLGIQGVGLCESCVYQTEDGVVHALIRTGTDLLYASHSTDDGTTWSKPAPTGFADDKSRFVFGRLPDGRYYYVGNPIPGGNRCPLVLYLSEDGYTFGQGVILRDGPCTLRVPGRHKGGLYGYPYALAREGYLYVIYSEIKENIAVTRVPLAGL